MTSKVAFVTGASRGIGAACAIELAEMGYDVVITARTVKEGEAREHSATIRESDTSPLPGSLESTATRIRQAGNDPLIVPADLIDSASLGAAVTTVLERKGRIDVVVHAGRFIGAGHMDRFMDTPIELLRRHMEGNVFAPLIINQLVLPSMIAQGGGDFFNITSAAGYGDPTKPAGGGGWGMCYGMSKGAFQRIAGFLNVELGDKGIRAYNIQPGFVATERMGQDMAKFGFANTGAPPQVVSKTMRWLLTDPGAAQYNGLNVEAQHFCHRHRLLAGWAGPPKINTAPISLDMSASNLRQLEIEHEAASDAAVAPTEQTAAQGLNAA